MTAPRKPCSPSGLGNGLLIWLQRASEVLSTQPSSKPRLREQRDSVQLWLSPTKSSPSEEEKRASAHAVSLSGPIVNVMAVSISGLTY